MSELQAVANDDLIFVLRSERDTWRLVCENVIEERNRVLATIREWQPIMERLAERCHGMRFEDDIHLLVDDAKLARLALEMAAKKKAI